MRRVLSILLLLALAGGIGYVWLQFDRQSTPAPDAASGIPDDALMVLRFQPGNWGSFPGEVQALSNILDEQFSEVARSMLLLDSTRLQLSTVQEILDEGPFQWSLHQIGTNSYSWIFSTGLPADLDDDARKDLYSIWGKGNLTRGRDFQGSTFLITEGSTYLVEVDGRLYVTPSEQLAEAAVVQAQKADPGILEQALERSGKPASLVMVNQDRIWKRVLNGSGWAGLEFRMQDGRGRLYGLLSSEEVLSDDHTEIPLHLIPATAYNLEWISTSPQHQLEADSARSAEVNGVFANLDQLCRCDYREVHIPNGNGFGRLVLPEGEVMILSNRDSLFTERLFSDHASPLDAFGSTSLRKLNDAYHGSLLFSAPDLHVPVAWQEEAWLFLADNETTARKYIRETSSHRTLQLLQLGLNDPTLVPDTCAEIRWIAGADSWPHTWPLSASAGRYSEQLLSLTSLSDRAFLDISLVSSVSAAVSTEDGGLARRWEIELDSQPIARPWMVTNHYTGAREILVQDEDFKLQLLSSTGQRIWQVDIGEAIRGEVVQLDALRNNKLQLLFSTDSRIYILDRNGNDLDGFPIDLPAQATTPVALFDYDNSKRYRLVIGTSDGALRNYTVEASATAGWNMPGFDTPAHEVDHIKIRDKDYILVREEGGKLHLLKRNGDVRYATKASTPAHNGGPSVVLAGESIASSTILYSDTGNNVLQIPFNKATESADLVGLMEGSSLLLTDLNGDRRKEILLADDRELKAYDPGLSRRFKTSFDQAITEPIQEFRFSSRDRRIGVTTGNSNEIWLVDDLGEIMEGFPLEGNSRFSIGDVDLDGRFELAVFTRYGTLCLYQLP